MFQRLMVFFIASQLCVGYVAADAESKIQYQGSPRHLTVGHVVVRESGRLLEVQMELRNSSRLDQQAFYRMVWLDESGFSVWDEEPWKPVLLHGGQVQLMKVVAPTPKARDFKIQFNSESNISNSIF